MSPPLRRPQREAGLRARHSVACAQQCAGRPPCAPGVWYITWSPVDGSTHGRPPCAPGLRRTTRLPVHGNAHDSSEFPSLASASWVPRVAAHHARMQQVDAVLERFPAQHHAASFSYVKQLSATPCRRDPCTAEAPFPHEGLSTSSARNDAIPSIEGMSGNRCQVQMDQVPRGKHCRLASWWCKLLCLCQTGEHRVVDETG